MENEDDIYNGIVNLYGQRATLTPIGTRLAEIGHYGTSGNAVDPDNFESPYNRPIEIPKTFKDVVLKMYPEIQNIVSAGYRENAMYDPNTFDAIKTYLVGIDLYFDDKHGMKKSKKEYGTELTDYLKMTYCELDFITLHVRSFIFPPEKTNEEKFFEVFGKLKDD
jgi:hypothetical protein